MAPISLLRSIAGHQWYQVTEILQFAQLRSIGAKVSTTQLIILLGGKYRLLAEH